VLEPRALLTTFTVTSTADSAPASNPAPGTLRWAVEEADTLPGPSVINFNLTTPATITLSQGSLDLSQNVIAIEGPGAALLSISGGGKSRVFMVYSAQNPGGNAADFFSGLTITGGLSVGGGGAIFSMGSISMLDCTLSGNSATTSANGGALENAGSATLVDCTIDNNATPAVPGSSGSGGGVDNESNGTLWLTDCTISNNSAPQGSGAGVMNFGTATLTDCTLSGNTGGSPGVGSIGGGLWNLNAASLTGCTISGNGAQWGGGVANSKNMTLTDCTISGNSGSYVGGLYCNHQTSLTGCTISGNTAKVFGGGVGVLNYQTTITDCTISGNSAPSGGGLYTRGTAAVTACTISGNTASKGGGVYEGPSGSQATLLDTIVAGNSSSGGGASDVGGTKSGLVTGSYNLIGTGGSGGITGGTNGNIVGVSKPGLGSLASNGGLTQTMALQAGSPAIAAGTGAGAPTTDQRGMPRPDSGAIDIGAFETQAGNVEPPAASDQAATTAVNTAVSGQVAASDPNGNALTYSVVTSTGQGTLSLQGNGAFTYTPASNFTGTDSFTFRAFDGIAYSNLATVSIVVYPVNPAPVAANDSYTAAEDTTLSVAAPGVLANDVGPAGTTLTAVLVARPADGALTLNSDGSFTYIPTTGFTGTDSFTYQASDGPYLSNVATVTFAVAPLVANNDSYSTAENTALKVAAPGVLSNDTDPGSLPLTAVLVAGASHGSATLNSDGSFTYTPATNFFGFDSFTYKTTNGSVTSNVATVSITVGQPPVANNDSYNTAENAALSVVAPGVLSNDTDPNNAPLTAVFVAGPAHGSLTLNSDGSFTYTPTAGFLGVDSFTYQASDGPFASGVATVTITVGQPPVARADSYAVDENLSLAAGGGATFLMMGSQPGDSIGQGLTYDFTPSSGTTITGFVYPSQGVYTNAVEIDVSGAGQSWTLDFAAPNLARLVPGTYLNATRWPFQAAGVPGLAVSGDGRGANTLTGQFTVTQASYDAKGNLVAFAASFVQHAEGSSPALFGQVAFQSTATQPAGVLVNDTDRDPGTTLTAALVSNPSHGMVALNPDGSFLYVPTAGFTGTDTFTYRASDGTFQSNVATVTLTVAPPVANNDSYSTTENTALTVAAPGVLANDTDAENVPLTAVFETGPAHGTLTLNSDGSFTYTPTPNFIGTDSFTYQASDGLSNSGNATVTLTVAGSAQAKFLKKDTTTQGTWVGAYGAQGYDIEGSAPGLPSYATVNIAGASTYTWAASTADTRALENPPSGPARSARTWYGSGFTIDVNLSDGQAHDLALYAVDWDNQGRQEQIQVIDPATGKVLDTESLASFSGGAYLQWKVSGHVQIRVTRLAGNNAVLSGLFLDA
jgi:VCBS repeat-containing protein